MAVWDACTQEPSPWLRWIECHPATLAATQDALLLATVTVAIAIPILSASCERQRRRRERREASVSFAAGLIGPASVVSMDAARARAVVRGFETGALRLPDDLQAAKVEIPGYLEHAMLKMYEFDNDVVAPTRSFISFAISYNAFIEQMRVLSQYNRADFEARRDGLVPDLARRLEALRQELSRAIGVPENTTHSIERDQPVHPA
jgi:hypothetical protein